MTFLTFVLVSVGMLLAPSIMIGVQCLLVEIIKALKGK